MKCGSVNESPVLVSLHSRPFVKGPFECRTVSKRGMSWLACSPDAVAWIDVTQLGIFSFRYLQFVTVKLKTSFAASSVDCALRTASVNALIAAVEDRIFVKTIPHEHHCRIVQQALDSSADYIIYVFAIEANILFICAIDVLQSIRNASFYLLQMNLRSFVNWAHHRDFKVPHSEHSSSCSLTIEKINFWKMVNEHVLQHGPFPPLKLFKHGPQSFCSKTEGGVDDAAPYWSTLRSSMVVLRWEQS